MKKTELIGVDKGRWDTSSKKSVDEGNTHEVGKGKDFTWYGTNKPSIRHVKIFELLKV